MIQTSVFGKIEKNNFKNFTNKSTNKSAIIYFWQKVRAWIFTGKQSKPRRPVKMTDDILLNSRRIRRSYNRNNNKWRNICFFRNSKKWNEPYQYVLGDVDQAHQYNREGRPDRNQSRTVRVVAKIGFDMDKLFTFSKLRLHNCFDKIHL